MPLTETPLNFCKLIKAVSDLCEPNLINLLFNIELKYLILSGHKYGLPAGPLNSFAFRDGPYEAPGTDFEKQFKINQNQYSEGQLAFNISRRIYNWFGIPENGIPYTKVEGKEKEISEEPFLNS